MSKDSDLAGLWCLESKQAAKESGLAGAIGPDQGDHLAPGYMKIHSAKHRSAAE